MNTPPMADYYDENEIFQKEQNAKHAKEEYAYSLRTKD